MWVEAWCVLHETTIRLQALNEIYAAEIVLDKFLPAELELECCVFDSFLSLYIRMVCPFLGLGCLVYQPLRRYLIEAMESQKRGNSTDPKIRRKQELLWLLTMLFDQSVQGTTCPDYLVIEGMGRLIENDEEVAKVFSAPLLRLISDISVAAYCMPGKQLSSMMRVVFIQIF